MFQEGYDKKLSKIQMADSQNVHYQESLPLHVLSWVEILNWLKTHKIAAKNAGKMLTF